MIVRREFGISTMTSHRWDFDERLSFPRPVIVRQRKYRFRDELEILKASLIALAASGEAKSTLPSPHRRSAEKPQRVGGVVT